MVELSSRAIGAAGIIEQPLLQPPLGLDKAVRHILLGQLNGRGHLVFRRIDYDSLIDGVGYDFAIFRRA